MNFSTILRMDAAPQIVCSERHYFLIPKTQCNFCMWANSLLDANFPLRSPCAQAIALVALVSHAPGAQAWAASPTLKWRGRGTCFGREWACMTWAFVHWGFSSCNPVSMLQGVADYSPEERGHMKILWRRRRHMEKQCGLAESLA